MITTRDALPAELQRSLMIEAGYRCAIPSCRTVYPLEFEHIEEHSRVKSHGFSNMIVLCRNCHGMKGNGPRKLDRKALKRIKANLGLINQRYNDTERRILEHFTRDEAATEVRLPATPVLFSYLMQDGLIEAVPDSGYCVPLDSGEDDFLFLDYRLTEHGKDLVQKLRDNQEVDAF